MTLDHAGFDKEMEAQKARARNAAAVETGDWIVVNDGEQQFVGYDSTTASTKILRYRKVKQKNKEYYQIVLSFTPFYAEMGGQVGDRGVLVNGDETIEIYDTKRENGMGVHLTTKLPSDVTATFDARIDEKARLATSSNHTATHLLHEALREVLGTHVEQKGSYVSPDVLRFDFSHFQKLTPEEISRVEHLANKKVRQAIARDEKRNVPISQALEMGAMALFGEKYGDEVRVIKYGDSVELCGGTHVDNTGNIGMIKIVSESSIAAGIRRIEAVTGERVEDMLDDLKHNLQGISAMFNNAPDVMEAVRKAIDENGALKKQAEQVFNERVSALTADVIAKAHEKQGVKVVSLKGIRMPEMAKNVAFGVRAQLPEKTVFIAATEDMNHRPLLTLMITEDLVKEGLNASAIVRDAAKLIQGGGGGQPGFAQAGGKNADGLSAAFDKMYIALGLE